MPWNGSLPGATGTINYRAPLPVFNR